MTEDTSSPAAAAWRVRDALAPDFARSPPGPCGFRDIFLRCESPIEQAFALILFQVAKVAAIAVSPQCAQSYAGRADLAGKRLLVWAQQPLLCYRADFLLMALAPGVPRVGYLVVECDGLAFHHSPAQRARDGRRQLQLIAAGYPVVRFSGRELFDYPDSVLARTLAPLAEWGWSVGDIPLDLNFRLCEALRELRMLARDPMQPTTLKPVGALLGAIVDEFGGAPSFDEKSPACPEPGAPAPR